MNHYTESDFAYFESHTISDICDKYDIDINNAYQLCYHHHIKFVKANKKRDIKPIKDYLLDHTIQETANHFGCTYQNILNFKKKYNLEYKHAR